MPTCTWWMGAQQVQAPMGFGDKRAGARCAEIVTHKISIGMDMMESRDTHDNHVPSWIHVCQRAQSEEQAAMVDGGT